MNLRIALEVLQIVLAVLLIGFILMQSGGGGLSPTLGGVVGYYRSKRGFERVVFAMTIVFSLLFVANALLILIVK